VGGELERDDGRVDLLEERRRGRVRSVWALKGLGRETILLTTRTLVVP